MNCHCDTRLTPHDGMGHCKTCGCYYRDGALDPAHTACRNAPTDPPAPVAPVAPYVNPNITDIPIEVTKGVGGTEFEVVDPEDSSTPERRTRRKA